MNRNLRTVVVAPLTSKGQSYPWRVGSRFRGTDGHVALDQLRAVDRRRLIKRVGRIDARTAEKLLASLQEMFAP